MNGRDARDGMMDILVRANALLSKHPASRNQHLIFPSKRPSSNIQNPTPSTQPQAPRTQSPLQITFKEIDVSRHFEACYAFRKDSYFCSFGTTEGYEASIGDYRARIIERMESGERFYYHIWHNDQIIGQLEFKPYSFKPGYGYVHLIYVVPAYRGAGVADKAQSFIQTELSTLNCRGAILSVSRENTRALRHYKKWNWQFLKKNSKNPLTDYYERSYHD